jgi:catechol 2,3-dioxygenase-like lactoylglutathione lyase family enzyme
MDAPPRHLGLHHVALFVPDLAQAKRFWVDLLGFAVEWEPDADNCYLTSGTDNVALHRGNPPGGAQRLDHVGIIVAEAAHVASWEAHLRGHGVDIVAPTKAHRDGATSCYVRCPAGTVVQIIHHPPIAPRLARA